MEATSERRGEEEAQFDCFDKSCIRSFANAQYWDYGKTQWHDLFSRVQLSLIA